MSETGPGADDEALRWRIAARAYGLWEQEGGPHGCDIDHWLRAEAEIAAGEAGQTTSAGTSASRAQKPEKPGG